MEKNYPRFFNFFKPGLFLVGFLFFGSSGFGQGNSGNNGNGDKAAQIGQPQVTENSICSDTFIPFNFELISGKGNGNRYTPDSQFTLIFTPDNGGQETISSIEISNLPGNNTSVTIRKEVNIAALNLVDGDYTISINSINPTVSSPQSNTFSIVTPIVYNQVESGNDSWIGHIYDGSNFETYVGGYRE